MALEEFFYEHAKCADDFEVTLDDFLRVIGMLSCLSGLSEEDWKEWFERYSVPAPSFPECLITEEGYASVILIQR